jgi:AraC-like DNA-binding protein
MWPTGSKGAFCSFLDNFCRVVQGFLAIFAKEKKCKNRPAGWASPGCRHSLHLSKILVMTTRYLFFLLPVFACSFPRIWAQDTALVKIKSFQMPIISLAHDGKGNIWFNTSSDLYTFDGERIKWVKHLSQRKTLIYKDGKVQFYRGIWGRDRRLVSPPWAGNEPWARYLPQGNQEIFAAPDKKGMIWVTRGQHLFGFKIERNFHRSLQGHSLRGILPYEGDLWVGSYSGVFKNGQLCLGDSIYTNGNLIGVSPNKILIPSYLLFSYDLLNHEIEHIPFPDAPVFKEAHADCLVQVGNQVWAGSSVGLFRLQGDRLVKEPLNAPVEYMSAQGRTLYLATTKGIYRRDEEGGLQRLHQFPEQVFNFIEKIGDAWWAASEQGIWCWKGGEAPAERLFPDGPLAQLETYAILRDKAGYYWASSVSGLYRFRPELDYYEHHLGKIEFNKRSFAAIRDTFYFGSTNGLVAFDPLGFAPMESVEDLPRRSTSRYLLAGLFVLLLAIVFFLYRQWKKTERILQAAHSALHQEPLPDPDSLAAKLEQYILQNITTVTVESLSTFAGVSERTLYRLLKEAYSTTPGDLIREVKVKRIRELMAQHPGLSREKMAYMVGYSPTNLSRILGELEV